jgi:hypothetical protein
MDRRNSLEKGNGRPRRTDPPGATGNGWIADSVLFEFVGRGEDGLLLPLDIPEGFDTGGDNDD